jgi:CCR4-NOT transcription complex subunit 4
VFLDTPSLTLLPLLLQEDAWSAIKAVDGFWLEGRHVRASFGTTKYCNSFLRGLPCNNGDCLYLHELGDERDRFTKEEIQVLSPLLLEH